MYLGPMVPAAYESYPIAARPLRVLPGDPRAALLSPAGAAALSVMAAIPGSDRGLGSR